MEMPLRSLAMWAGLALAGCAVGARVSPDSAGIRISDEDASKVGRRIYRNEAGGKAEFLVHWNAGEEFASVGIGHFLWYPKGYSGPFVESFPKLLAFMRERGAAVPAWLKGGPPCPWNSREEFLADKESPRSRELRAFLSETVALQARFEARRLEEALPKMLSGLSEAEAERVRRRFYAVAGAGPSGLYALMDYVNFKGEGTSPTERYNGEGWGLLQVLEGMDDGAPAPLPEFARSAKAALARRIRNSPPARNEARWQPVWDRRIDTYCDAP